MKIKLNVGAGPTWEKKSWHVLDHKIKAKSPVVIQGTAANIDLEDLGCSTVFCSHVLEHIPHIQLESVLTEFHRVLEDDGILRILVPDLHKLAKAYVNKDSAFFEELIQENEIIRTDLGYGGMLATHFVGPGQDTALFNRQLTKFIAGYSHLYMYDFEMLEILLTHAGFYEIEQRSFCSSKFLDYEEPFHVVGLEPVWHNLNQKFYKEHGLVHYYDPNSGGYNINFKTTGFDRNPLVSLIIECKKTSNKQSQNTIIEGKNYNQYSQSLLKNKKFCLKCKMMAVISEIIENETEE